ncbi:MAG: YraN family protein [Maricaulaceae bacterium]
MQNKQSRRRFERHGRWAEWFAVLYLKLKGYRILELRYKTKLGEIDIIARKGDLLAIVEVKQRSTLAAAHESLTWQAQQRISNAVDVYLSRCQDAQSLGIRFDAIFIVGAQFWRWRVHHIIDVWREG